MTNDLGLDELFASRSRSRQTHARSRETVSGETKTPDTVTAVTVSGVLVSPETVSRDLAWVCRLRLRLAKSSSRPRSLVIGHLR